MDEDAIRQVVQSLADAWNVHDAEAFARAFQENAHFTNVFGMEAEGRAAIARFHAPIFETMFRDSRLECAPPKIRFIRPDVAAVDVQWSMTGARDPNGNAWPERHGLINLIMTPDEGRWAIAVMHNMDLPAPELRDAQRRLQQSA